MDPASGTSARVGQTSSGPALLVASGATFLAMLDTTVVNVAFPDLRADFAATPLADLSWVVSGYAAMFAALLAAAGRLADVLGRRKLFTLSLLLFTLSSAACALAPNVEWLIAFRVVQGVGAAGMIPAALGLVLAATPAEHRTTAVGVWAAAGSMAAAAGPSLGGLLVDVSSWRSVFWINVPLGLLLLYGTGRGVARDVATHQALPDLLGTLMLALGVGLLVVGLTKGNDWGWGAAQTLAAIVLGATLIVVALLKSLRHHAPAIEITLWRNQTFAVANLTSLLFGVAVFAWLLIGPLYLTAVWDYSVLKAGLALSPGAVTSAIAAIAVGKRAGARGQRIAVVAGALLFVATAFGMYLALDANREFLAVWLPGNLVSGIAIGMVLTGVASAVSLSLPPTRFAAGTGLNLTARQLGGSLGIAALAAILTINAAPTVNDFRNVFLFCGAAGSLAVLSGIALLRRAAPVDADAPVSAIETPARI